ncbi:LysR family transcriptional regulator [Streptomyces violarus]|uniref:LysR family transcriptional regulator n=1 Tax=Streptomyces violarus TaxID=67380 RepID=UPI0021C1825F|nr:LysR family transcriptional regulator [Streptomyces violarus]MCT9138494.1 LysR family transcriptional regulator [Streptomyces violarus]
MIEVRQARYFLAVAETLHFGRAAEQLRMSQPPLSQAILQLERQLGVRLFDRGERRVRLTETGRAFAEECRRLVAAARHAHEVATQAEAGLVGTLRIGVVTSALSEPLLGTLSAFRDARPRVDLHLTEVDTGEGQEAVARHEIDLAVIRPSAPVRGLRVRPWRHDQFVIALPDGHPLTGDTTDPVDLSGFADEPWVWLRREASPDYHDQLMATCRRAGFTPEARHVANSILTQLAMVACGLGVTLVPNVAVRSIQGPIAYRPLSDPADIVELSLVSRDGGHEPLVEEFLRHAAGSRAAQVGGEFVPPVEGEPPLEDRLRGDGQREPEEGP